MNLLAISSTVYLHKRWCQPPQTNFCMSPYYVVIIVIDSICLDSIPHVMICTSHPLNILLTALSVFLTALDIYLEIYLLVCMTVDEQSHQAWNCVV